MRNHSVHEHTIHHAITGVCTLLSPRIPHIHSAQEQLVNYVALLLQHSNRLNLIGTTTIEAVCDQCIDVLNGFDALCRAIADIDTPTGIPSVTPPNTPYGTPHPHNQPCNITEITTSTTNTTDGSATAQQYRPPLTIADIGSGNGLPGIPCAMLLPEHQFVLVETRQRRIDFLTSCVNRLALANIKIVHSAYQELSAQYDIVLVRALTNFTNKACRKLKKLLHHHGGLVAYKGNDQQFLIEHAALSRCFQQVVAHSVLPMNDSGGKQGRIIITATNSRSINNAP